MTRRLPFLFGPMLRALTLFGVLCGLSSCATLDGIALRGSLLATPHPPADFVRSSSSRGVDVSLRYKSIDRDEASTVLDDVVEVMESLQDLYGPLPTRKLEVVLDPRADRLGTRFNSGGVVHLQTRDLRMPREWLVGALAHEIAHEWWGHRVAADPRDRQGITETLAEVSALHVVTKKYGAKQLFANVESLTASYLDGDRAPVAVTRDKLYSKVMLMYWQLLHVVGEESFSRAARRTLAEYNGRELSHRAFFAVVEAESGKKVRWLLDWLYETDRDVDFSLSHVAWEKQGEAYVTRFSVVERLGRFDYPLEVPIRVDSADGKSRRLDRVIGRNQETLTVVTEAPVVAVEIDPEGVMWDVDRSNNAFGRHVWASHALGDSLAPGKRERVAEIVRLPNLVGLARTSLWLRDEAEATLLPIPGRASRTAPTWSVDASGRMLSIVLRTETRPLAICADMEKKALVAPPAARD